MEGRVRALCSGYSPRRGGANRRWRLIMVGFTDGGLLRATGAYGREATEADWKAGKDFRVVSGPYFSIRDVAKIKADGFNQIVFFNARGFVEFVVKV